MTYRITEQDAPGVAIITALLVASSEQLTGGTTVDVDIAVSRAIDIVQRSGTAAEKLADSENIGEESEAEIDKDNE